MRAATFAPRLRDARWRGMSADECFERACAWLLGFAPIVYLGLSGGGYDIVARSEVGVVMWWIVLLGVLIGVLPRAGMRGPAWIAPMLLGGFFAWTWIAASWSQSEEQTLAEAARVATYLGVLVLGFCLLGRRTVRPLLYGLACAVTLVSGLAVLSRLVPGLFPANTAARFYATSRLSYPFDYSDGVGEFAALGLPLLLFVATEARTFAGRVLGAAGLPVVVLCLALTVSRGGILAAAVGLIFFIALMPDRIPRLATALTVAVGVLVLMVALFDRAGVRNVLVGQAPAAQRHSMLIVLAVTCVGVALVQAGITLVVRRGTRPRTLVVSRRGAQAITGLIAAVVVAVVIVGIAAGTVHHLWTEFKQPNPPAAGNSYFRLLSIAGSHRYQYWQAAIAAFHTHPWKGIGPGTFQFYWSQHNSLSEFVRNAHSLFIETLAEAGVIGLALIGGLFAFVLIAGSGRALNGNPERRPAVATAVAGVAAFCAAAAFDWVWQIGVIPFIALLLVAVAVGEHGERVPARGARQLFSRLVPAAAVIPALWAIVVPLSATVAVRSSQTAASRGQVRTALSDAATAQRLEPGAASSRLQRALVLEQIDDITGASEAIAQAEAREPTNWRIWLVASRIATENDQPAVALADYRRARSLNPTSSIFAG